MLRHDCLGLPEGGEGKTDGAGAAGAAGVVGGEAGAAASEGKAGDWKCPKVLFTTSTKDDRVHPGHARKMVCALREDATAQQAPTVHYWENMEGGHGGAADNSQRAFMWALSYEFLADALGVESKGKL
jgi:prolyl oligopeptidase